MKIRLGFVSNSSSSSFIIVTTADAWQNAQRQLIEKVGEDVATIIIGEFGKPNRAKIFGQDALVFSGTISSEEYGYYGIAALKKKRNVSEDEEEDLILKAYDKQYELDKILKADGVSYIDSQCC